MEKHLICVLFSKCLYVTSQLAVVSFLKKKTTCLDASSAHFCLEDFIRRSSKILSSSARLDVDCLWTASFRFLCRFSIPISRLWLGHWGSVRVLSRSHSFWLSALGCCHVERWTSGCVQLWFYAMEPVFLFRSILYWAQFTVFLIAASFLMPAIEASL